MNIFLIGYRGTGKSTVGDILAKRLGWSLVDSDEQIERTAGKTIANIFEEDGEASFRQLEMRVVNELSTRDRCVISLGGGAILRKENRAAIATCGTAVWLQASAKSIHARVNADQSTTHRRPNLTAAGGLQEIQALLAERSPIYQQCADITVDTEGKAPEGVVDEIVRLLDLL